MADDDLLEKFLLAVERVRTERRALGAEERAAIAREVGLSESDLAAARERGERCLAQTEGFLRNKLWDDALRALEQADALLPDDLRVVSAMAQTYRGRYRETDDAADRDHVRRLATRCLELDPRHEPAFEWLREIDASTKLERRNRRAWLLLGASAAALVALVYAGISALPERPAVVVTVSSPDPSPAATTATTVATTIAGAPDCGAGTSYCTLDAPVKVASGAAGDTTLELVPGKLEVAPSGVKLVVAGRITHHGATELAGLSFTTVFLDASGTEIGRQPLIAHADFYPPMRDGESDVFHLSVDVPATTRSARIEAGKRDAQPGAKTYGDVGEYAVAFEPAPPSHLSKLGAVKRSHYSRKLGEMTSIETVVAFENRGETLIHSLEVEFRALDKSGKVVEKRSETLVYSHMPPLAPGERRVKKLSLYAPGDPVTDALVVTKIE